MQQREADEPSIQVQGQLREEMAKLSEDNKDQNNYQKFSQKLGEYLKVRSNDSLKRDTLSYVPVGLRSRAANVLDALLSQQRVDVTEDNKLIIDDRIIPDSNLTDVVRYLVGKSERKPSGVDQVKTVFDQQNLPKSLITNPHIDFQVRFNTSY